MECQRRVGNLLSVLTSLTGHRTNYHNMRRRCLLNGTAVIGQRLDCLGQGQGEIEGGAHAWLAFDPNTAVMLPHNRPGNRQP